MRSIAITLLFFTVIAGGATTLACRQEGPAERAGRSIDEAGDDAKDALDDAGDAVQDAAEDAREKAKEAVQ